MHVHQGGDLGLVVITEAISGHLVICIESAAGGDRDTRGLAENTFSYSALLALKKQTLPLIT